jgi:hypothetical protein
MVPGAVSPGNATADMTVRQFAAATGRIGLDGHTAAVQGRPSGWDAVVRREQFTDRPSCGQRRPAAEPDDPVAGALFRHGRHAIHPN